MDYFSFRSEKEIFNRHILPGAYMRDQLSLYKTVVEGFVNDSFIERIISGINKKEGFSNCTAIFSPVDTPREAILNRCRDRSDKNLQNGNRRRLCWLPPFHCWEMFTIGNLSLALLWHIYRSLPQQVLADEKVIYKLGKISVTLPALTDKLPRTGSTLGQEHDRHTSITTKAFPPDKKSSVSSIFSACEQIVELSDTFHSLGTQIAQAGNFDALVVPVLDIDLCLPEQAVSLLFAIRNFICSDSISIVIAADGDILSRFLISIYDNSLTLKQGIVTLSTLFDDRIYLPSPNIEKLIQVIDNSLNKDETDYIISVIATSGILSRMSNPTMVNRGFNRFNSFIDNSLGKFSRDDYAVGLLLFLFGIFDPETVTTLAIFPDLQQVITTLRVNFNNYPADSGTASTEEPVATKRFNLNQSETYSDVFPAKYRELFLKNSNLFTNILLAIPPAMSDAAIAKWIIDIAPFM